MAVTYQAIVVVHVVAAMVWFGMGVSLPRRLRLGLAAGRPGAGEVAAEVVRAARVALIAGGVAIASGLLLILVGGGFALYAARIHAGLGLALLAFALALFAVRPAWGRVARIAAGTGPLDEALPLAKRAAMLHGITHALQLATLALMLWRV